MGLVGPAALIELVDSLVPPDVWLPAPGSAEYLCTATTVGSTTAVATPEKALGHWGHLLDAARATRSAMELWAAEQSWCYVVVHAGVVVVGGRAIVLPGRSGAGKSTMTASLIRAGARYYSDEYAVIDRNGMVLPYPRPLKLRDPGDRSKVCDLDPRDLGAPFGGPAAPIGLVADLTFDPGLATPHIRELNPACAVLSLVGNAVAARSRPELVLDATARAVASCRAVQGRRGSSEGAARQLLDLLDS